MTRRSNHGCAQTPLPNYKRRDVTVQAKQLEWSAQQHLSSAEVKKAWSFTSASPHVFYGTVLTREKNFTSFILR